MDCSLRGSSVHGIFQARILEWVAISFSRRSSQPRDRTKVSRVVSRRFTVWATREDLWKGPNKYLLNKWKCGWMTWQLIAWERKKYNSWGVEKKTSSGLLPGELKRWWWLSQMWRGQVRVRCCSVPGNDLVLGLALGSKGTSSLSCEA